MMREEPRWLTDSKILWNFEFESSHFDFKMTNISWSGFEFPVEMLLFGSEMSSVTRGPRKYLWRGVLNSLFFDFWEFKRRWFSSCWSAWAIFEIISLLMIWKVRESSDKNVDWKLSSECDWHLERRGVEVWWFCCGSGLITWLLGVKHLVSLVSFVTCFNFFRSLCKSLISAFYPSSSRGEERDSNLEIQFRSVRC